MVMHMKIAGWTAPIYNISGLAFGKAEVQSRVDAIRPFADRRRRVVFSARWDQEKQPSFFMNMIEFYITRPPAARHEVQFAIFSGGPLRSNNPEYVTRARSMASAGLLEIHENLNKNQYYDLLNDTRVLFNCALQDWVSNTVSEADTLGCNVLYPAYRSFPETFANDHERLYIPWAMDDALAKLDRLLLGPHRNQGLISDWTNGTVDRIIDIMKGLGEQWRRDDARYRDHAAENKYFLRAQ
jgi:hypothetical protein